MVDRQPQNEHTHCTSQGHQAARAHCKPAWVTASRVFHIHVIGADRVLNKEQGDAGAEDGLYIMQGACRWLHGGS